LPDSQHAAHLCGAAGALCTGCLSKKRQGWLQAQIQNNIAALLGLELEEGEEGEEGVDAGEPESDDERGAPPPPPPSSGHLIAVM